MTQRVVFETDSVPTRKSVRQKKAGFVMRLVLKYTPITDTRTASAFLFVLAVVILLFTIWYAYSSFMAEPELEVTNFIDGP